MACNVRESISESLVSYAGDDMLCLSHGSGSKADAKSRDRKAMNLDVRWRQRFDNYEKALRLLREALQDVNALSLLEKEGAVQRFEFTFELAWKTLKDYLIYSGVVVDPITPRSVIKQAFAAQIISDGQLWIDMLEYRNLLSHT